MEVDRGYAWVVALSGTGLQVLTSASYCVVSMVYIPMLEHFEASKAKISLIGAIMFFVFGLSALFAGPLIRRYGRRRIGMVAPLIVTSGYVLTAFCTELWQVYITLGILSGIGFSAYPIVAVSTVYRWFDKKQSIALGVVMVGPAMGAFIWPIFMNAVISRYNWRGAIIIAAGVNLHAIVFFTLLRPPHLFHGEVVIERKEIADDHRTHSSEIQGVSSVTRLGEGTDVSMEKLSKSPNLKEDVRVEFIQPPKENPRNKRLLAFLVLFRDPSFVCFLAATLFIFIGHIVPYSYTTPRGILLGHSETQSALLSSILGLCGGIGRMGAGLVGQLLTKYRRMYVCALAVFIHAVVCVISLVSTEYWFLALNAAFSGISTGFYEVYLMGACPDLFGSLFAPEMTGINLFTAGVASFASNALAGWLMDTTGNPSLPFAVTGGAQSLGAMLMLVSVGVNRKQSG